MRRNGYMYMILMLTAAVSTCFGIYKKGTYTSIGRDGIYPEYIHVAELPEEYALSACESMREKLPDAPLAAKVTAAADVEHLGYTSRQLVQVQRLYQGEGLKEDELLYITFQRWSLSLYGEPYSMERGFVNILNVGEDYLIFLDERLETFGEEIPVYELYGDSVIAPVFSCSEHTNRIVPPAGENTYVPYSQVRENEFFAETQKGLEAMEKLKGQMLEKYVDSE